MVWHDGGAAGDDDDDNDDDDDGDGDAIGDDGEADDDDDDDGDDDEGDNDGDDDDGDDGDDDDDDDSNCYAYSNCCRLVYIGVVAPLQIACRQTVANSWTRPCKNSGISCPKKSVAKTLAKIV